VHCGSSSEKPERKACVLFVVTDARNAAALDTAMSQVIYCRAVIEALPKELLLN